MTNPFSFYDDSAPPPPPPPPPPAPVQKRRWFGKVLAWVAIVFGVIFLLGGIVSGIEIGPLLVGLFAIAAGVAYLKILTDGKRKLWIAPALAVIPAFVVLGLTAPAPQQDATTTSNQTSVTKSYPPLPTTTSTTAAATTTTTTPSPTPQPQPFVAAVPTEVTTEYAEPTYSAPPAEPVYVPPVTTEPPYVAPEPAYVPPPPAPVDVPNPSVGTVRGGAYCSGAGSTGLSSAGNVLVCATAKDGRLRWQSP